MRVPWCLALKSGAGAAGGREGMILEHLTGLMSFKAARLLGWISNMKDFDQENQECHSSILLSTAPQPLATDTGEASKAYSSAKR